MQGAIFFRWIRWTALICAGSFPALTRAQLQLPGVFADNMVLQRDRPIHVWGTAVPGVSVAVGFAGQTRRAVAAGDSSWSVYFPKQSANATPQTLRIESRDTLIEWKNILIGDIWICLGQSNMEWPMSREAHWPEEKLHADQPLIRFLNPPPAGRYVYGVPFTDSLRRRLNRDSFYLWNGWRVSDSQSVQSMSAVAYYFARSIVDRQRVPVGLIHLSIGGAPLETFISEETLRNSAQFAPKVEAGNWLENEALPAWPRERGRQNVGGEPADGLPVYADERGPNHAYKPGFAFASGIEPILPLPVKGMIWYQGESNAQDSLCVVEYPDLFRLMVEDYRKKWGQPEMPVYWVQLSSIDTLQYHSGWWPQFRDGQRRSMEEIRHSGMAVSSDIGARNDVHPTNKKTVGERLARWALFDVYHQNIIPSGPLPLKARYKKGMVSITFKYRAKGLSTADGQPLKGFSLDGITAVEARIEGGKLRIPVSVARGTGRTQATGRTRGTGEAAGTQGTRTTGVTQDTRGTGVTQGTAVTQRTASTRSVKFSGSAGRARPAFVYYGWQPFSAGNLVNSEGLPASTFKIAIR